MIVMKKVFFLFLFIASFFACQQQEERPNSILDKGKMTEVLVDVELLEAVVKQKMLDRKYPKKNVPVYYHQVMEKNGISYEQFQESFSWWSIHPKKMKEIYDEVNNKLEAMKEELPEEKKKDEVEKELKKH